MQVNIKASIKTIDITEGTTIVEAIGEYNEEDRTILYTENDELETKVILTMTPDLVTLIRENDDAIITFYFENEKETTGVYSLKEENRNFDMMINTDKFEVLENSIFIKYYLNIEGENMGIFEYTLNFIE